LPRLAVVVVAAARPLVEHRANLLLPAVSPFSGDRRNVLAALPAKSSVANRDVSEVSFALAAAGARLVRAGIFHSFVVSFRRVMRDSLTASPR
jgi:hypothetical protein